MFPVRFLCCVVLAAACSTPPRQDTCGDAPCAANQRCVGNECILVCSTASPCPDGARCQDGLCFSSATSSSGSASSSQSISSSSAAPGSSMPSSSSATGDAGPNCAAMAQPCFQGSDDGNGGCRFDYKCADGTVCVNPDDRCVPSRAPPAGPRAHAQCTPTQTCQAGDCYPMVHGQRMFILCNGFENGGLAGWNTSRQYCQAQWPGFDLASFRNAEEQAFLRTLLVYGEAWMGLTDRTDINFNTVEGTWVWADGSTSAPGAMAWCTGRPDGAAAQNCATARGDGAEPGCWDDQNCSDPHAFICAR